MGCAFPFMPFLMRSLIARHLHRHEPADHWYLHLKSSIGVLVGVGLVGALAERSGLPLLLAPLAPTSLLLFAQPHVPPSQPIAVFGGYFIATVLATLGAALFAGVWWAAVLATAVAILLMLRLRVTHAPAASLPLLVYGRPIAPGTLFEVLFVSCVLLVGISLIWRRLPARWFGGRSGSGPL